MAAESETGVELDPWQKEWAEGIKNPVPLHPELEEYLLPADPDSRLKMAMLKHPLVFSIPYSPVMNWLCNKQFEEKTRFLQECVSERRWTDYVALHERPYRFNAFETICRHLRGREYWKLLSWMWSDSENLHQIGYKRIRRAFSRHSKWREYFMDANEKKFLAKLPDQVRVFRGHERRNQKGFSWTLGYQIAVWFGQRYARFAAESKVSEGLVQRSDIIGLFLGRGEMEVVVNPSKVQDLQLMKLVERPDSLEALRRELISQFRLDGRTDHGPDHWNKVDRNGVELCKRIPEADETVVRLFAIFHDSCRRDEDDDPGHGPRAASLVSEMYEAGAVPGITEEQFKKLEWACRHHNGGKPVSDPTIGVCFDADRLDLIRVGIIPDPRLLSTEAAKGLIGLI